MIAIDKIDMMYGINHGIPIDSDGKIVLFLVILLFLSDDQSLIASSIEVVKYLHNMTMAAVLLVEHEFEFFRNFFIQSLEETFFIELRISVVDLFRDNLFVKPFKIIRSHMP